MIVRIDAEITILSALQQQSPIMILYITIICSTQIP